MLIGSVTVSDVVGEDTLSSVSCTGRVYKAKKDDVPVYQEPKLTAKVVSRLKLGERVCYVGEEKDFAIVDWDAHQSVQNDGVVKSKPDDNKKERLVFVRTVDLWAPPNIKEQVVGGVLSLFEQAKSYMEYMRQGGVPEDPLMPYRPIMNLFQSNDSEPAEKESDCKLDDNEQEACEPSGSLN